MVEFPTTTFALLTLNIVIFIFISPSIDFFTDNYGFTPANFQPITLLTYMFIHIDYFHLLGNMAMLLALGIVLEPRIGWKNLLLVYFLSGLTAIPFDYLGRIVMNIPLDMVLVGSSGAIFGLFYLCGILKPYEKVPTIIIVGTIIPLVIELLTSIVGVFLENPIFLMVFVFAILVFVGSILIFTPTLPVIVALILYFIFWVMLTVTGFMESVSYFGHAGGMLGGILALFLFRKKKANFRK